MNQEEDAVLLAILVMKEKETVMVLMMEVSMMVMRGVKEILSAAAIIARNLAFTSTRRMIVVKNQKLLYHQ